MPVGTHHQHVPSKQADLCAEGLGDVARNRQDVHRHVHAVASKVRRELGEWLRCSQSRVVEAFRVAPAQGPVRGGGGISWRSGLAVVFPHACDHRPKLDEQERREAS